jgi:AcrR family transcriptional regulator
VNSTSRKAEFDRRGRPRSDESRQAILEAAFELVLEVSYANTTIEGIAARAGTGKQTIYRWWRGKADVVLEALTANAAKQVPSPNTGSLRGDLLRFITATFAAGRKPGTLPVLRALMAQAQLDPAFAVAFRERFLRSRREALAEVIRHHPDDIRVPEEVALDVVFGVLWYRILATHAPLNSELAAELTTLLTR